MLEPFLLALGRAAPFLATAGLGAAAGALGVFRSNTDDEQELRAAGPTALREGDGVAAMRVLNRYALYVAFPALIFAELTNPALTLPSGPNFYVTHAAAFALQLAVLAALASVAGRVLGRPGVAPGPVMLTGAYGNIAYLGIPFCAAVLGDGAAGIAALSASLHVTLGVGFGPWLLVAKSDNGGGALMVSLRRIARLPLVWAPLVAVTCRWLPEPVIDPLRATVSPVGASAGPVAMFMLGLYLHAEPWRGVWTDGALWGVAAAKLCVYPAVFAVLVVWIFPVGVMEQNVMILQAGMPTALTTFALASELGTGQCTAAGAIVLTTLLSLVTLPIWAAMVAG